jgi:hypothetical protein
MFFNKWFFSFFNSVFPLEHPQHLVLVRILNFGQKTILLRKKTTMQFYCQNTIRSLKDTKLCLPYTCWKMEVGITTFLKFLLAKSSFLCRFHVESVNIFVLLRFELSTCSSINKQCHFNWQLKNSIHLNTLLNLSQGSIWIFNVICQGLFWGEKLFIFSYIGGIVDHCCLKIFLITYLFLMITLSLTSDIIT